MGTDHPCSRVLNRIRRRTTTTPSFPASSWRVFPRGDRERVRQLAPSTASLGIPVPAFASSLAYYDAMRAERLPAALRQGQRDFFGALTYERTDSEGKFHAMWIGERSEVQA